MSRRVVVLILAGVIAAAVAIPALADPAPTAQSASVKGLSKRALAKAKKSLRIARGAKRVARRATIAANDAATAGRAAQGSASSAQSTATAAQGTAEDALKAANAARDRAGDADVVAREAKAEAAASRAAVGFAGGARSTTAATFVPLAEGPSVTVTVPPSGLVQVWAQAKVSDGGAVALYEDGQPVAGQAECFEGESEAEGILFASPGGGAEGEAPLTLGTPAALPLCGTLGAPAPVLFQSSAGSHTFELRYAAACSCSGAATFSERRLVVAPLP